MTKHIHFLDWLRAFAISAVLIQHASSYYIEAVGLSIFANVLRGVTRWNNLIFVMISGYLFLSKEISINVMWKKYITRILRTLMIWSALYTLYNTANEYYLGKGGVQLIKNAIGSFAVGGTNPMWYLFMLLALYAFVPIIRVFITNARSEMITYSIALTGILSSFFSTIILIGPINTVIGLDIARMQSVFSSLFIFYLLFGYWWIGKKEYNGKTVIVALGVISICLMAIIQVKTSEMLPPSLVLNIPIAAALVILAKALRPNRFIRTVADCSFGIYLAHTFVQYMFRHTGVEEFLFEYKSAGLLVYLIMLFLVSFLITWLLRLSKYGRFIT